MSTKWTRIALDNLAQGIATDWRTRDKIVRLCERVREGTRAEQRTELSALRAQLAALQAAKPVALDFPDGAYLARHPIRGEQYIIDIEEYNGVFVAIEYRHNLHGRTVEAIVGLGYTLIPLLVATPERVEVLERVLAFAEMGVKHDPRSPDMQIVRAMLQKMKGEATDE